MKKVTGIKSVDFKITALGHGVVNWNGSPSLTIQVEGRNKTISNHSMPKLRGYTNIKGHWEDGNPMYKHPEDIDFRKNPLYISQNCIRHHLFREQAFDLQSPEIHKNMDKVLCSLTGLVRGYVIPKNENKKTSALLLTDFVDQLCNGNYEQMGRSGSKEKEATKSGSDKSTSMFSKTTFGDTEYEAFGSISIEQLQFISLDNKFGRQAMIPNSDKEGKELAGKITQFIKTLGSGDAQAVYHSNYVRQGTIFDDGEVGVLLNDAAVDILVEQTIALIKNLTIRQAKGYMYVDDVEVDYNSADGNKSMMRIKHNPVAIDNQKGNKKYAVYFEGK